MGCSEPWGKPNLDYWTSTQAVLHELPNTRGKEVAWAWPKSKSKRILLREQHAVLMMSGRIHVGSSSQDYNNHNRCMYLQYSLWPKRESFCADDFCPLQTWEGFTLPFMMHATDCSTGKSVIFIGPTSIYKSNTRIQCSANLSLLKIAHAVQWLMPPTTTTPFSV